MSYSDSTVVYYDNRIAECYERIRECRKKIKQLENDCDELKDLRKNAGKLNEIINQAVSGTATRLDGLPSAVATPGSHLKMSYFSSFIETMEGDEFRRVSDTMESLMEKITQEDGKRKKQIQELTEEIGQLYDLIDLLKQRRDGYILQKQQELEKIAEEMAAAAEQLAGTTE